MYKCDEIENVQQMASRHHTNKNKTDDNTEAWHRLSEFLEATRKEFRDCPSTFINSYF